MGLPTSGIYKYFSGKCDILATIFRRAADLARPAAEDADLVILAAAYLGRARLIDNLRVRRRP